MPYSPACWASPWAPWWRLGSDMGAFDGLRIPYDHTTDGEDPEPGPAHYPGDYASENSNMPYLYPWGRKERNPFFVGPYPAKD
jgi:hypothetical protein